MFELLIVALVIALPAAFACEFGVNRVQRNNALRFLFVAAAATLLFSPVYAVAWGSISWYLAAAWGFAFIAWPSFAFPSLRVADA